MSGGPLILGLEAATGVCSVAVSRGASLLAHQRRPVRASAGELLEMVNHVLVESGVPGSALDAVAVGRGPGGFTGVRVAIGVAQGIALGLDRPAIPISTLHVLAETMAADPAPDSAPPAGFCAVLDARMGEVYTANFAFQADHRHRTLALGDERLMPPASLPALPLHWWMGGSGLGAHPEAPARLGGQWVPDAVPDIAAAMGLALARFEAGAGVDAKFLQPRYLRDRVARRPA